MKASLTFVLRLKRVALATACAFSMASALSIAAALSMAAALSIAAALSMAALLSATPAFAEGFPGQGSSSDWSDALPYYNQGNKLLQEQRYEAAARRFNEAIDHYTFDPDFYVNLGVAYRKLGEFKKAEQSLRCAIRLNDKDWMPWSDLANVYLKQDKLKEAVDLFQRTLKCNPPAAEKTVILQDIKDINKILAMQQPPAPANPAAKNNKQNASVKSNTQTSNIKAKPHGAGSNPAESAAHSDDANKTPANLQGTGWDYVYQGKGK